MISVVIIMIIVTIVMVVSVVVPVIVVAIVVGIASQPGSSGAPLAVGPMLFVIFLNGVTEFFTILS